MKSILIYAVFMNLAGFAAMGADKRRAKSISGASRSGPCFS